MVEQKEVTKGKAALLFALSAVAAVVSATMLHGWHVYASLAATGVAIFYGFLRWNRRP